MACCDETNIDGTTVQNITLINGRIIGGSLLGTVIGKDCEGADVLAGQHPLATCADLDAALAELPAQAPRVTAITFTADGRLVLTFSDGSQIDTPVPVLAEQVAAVFRDCAGQPHVAGAQLPTCAQLQEAIAVSRLTITGANPPTTTENPTLPTTLHGGRDALLGRPIGWVNVGGYVLPYYGFVDCGGSATHVEL